MTRTRLAGRPRGFRLAAALLALFLGAALPAFARQLVIKEFSAEIMVQENGVLDVTETISPRNPPGCGPAGAHAGGKPDEAAGRFRGAAPPRDCEPAP